VTFIVFLVTLVAFAILDPTRTGITLPLFFFLFASIATAFLVIWINQNLDRTLREQIEKVRGEEKDFLETVTREVDEILKRHSEEP
jgi:hypothetical protein